MIRSALALIAAICSRALLVAADTPQEHITDASSVFNEIMAAPDKGIRRDLLEKAHCIVIVPGMKQAAFGVGGKFGRGYAICRREKDGWGAPAAIRVEGGSFGFQIGASSTDVIMLVMNKRGMRRLVKPLLPPVQSTGRPRPTPTCNFLRNFSPGPSPRVSSLVSPFKEPHFVAMKT